MASYDSYEKAQFTVDKLSDNNFPVKSTAIVAEDLKMVEQVTGRLTNWRAFFNGAVSGAFTGAFIGFLMGILNLFQPVISAAVLAFYGLALGAFVGAVLALIGYSLSGGKRDFTSLKRLEANRYNVMVEANLKAQAETVLAQN
ncbi:MAG: glycine zipper family protein [Trueperaceae bacterium]|nr:glycine zipper family protein [Trueperaceae bacterium]